MKSIWLIFWLVFLGWSCNKDNDPLINPDCVRGQGAITSEARDLASFHSIDNLIFADIFLSQGPQEDIILEAQPNILEIVRTQVVAGELRVFSDQCMDIDTPVVLHIVIPEIRSLKLTGVGQILAENDFELTDLSAHLMGVGEINLRGNAESLDIRLIGVGTVKAFDLNTDRCKILLSGVGDAEVFVNTELDVTITGSGDVSYKGDPSITSNISGSGSIVNSN